MPELPSSSNPLRPYIVLAVGILSTSFAATFVRFALMEGLPSLFIAAGRLTIAAAILTPFVIARYRPALSALRRRELLLAVASGFMLALHFVTWMSSLQY